MAESNRAWMTSFYFQQELRSYYMNGVLSASLRPGIYNANIGVFTKGSASSGSSSSSANSEIGIYLFIKKGTTFVFSNNYDINTQGVVERNLDDVGNFLIKCFAMEDIVTPLLPFGSLGETNSLSEDILGYKGKSASKRFYIIATIKYDKDISAGSATGVITPEFKFALNNRAYTEGVTSKNPFYTSITSGGGEGHLPDGYTPTEFEEGGSTETSYGKESYLWLGTVVHTGKENYYLAGEKATTWDNTKDSSAWMKEHTFIGRGFPEFRHSLSADNFTESPDFLIDTGSTLGTEGFRNGDVSLNRVVLDVPSTMIGNRIIKNSYKWQNLYSSGPYKYNVSSQNTKAIEIKNYESANNEELKNLENGNYLITDFIYLTLKNKNSDLGNVDVKNIYDSDNLVDIKNYSYISKFSQGLNSPRDLYSSFITSTVTKGTTNAEEITENIFESKGILPLDISSINIKRLLNIIENKNILPKLINKLRQLEDIDPLNEDILIPAAFIFRGFKKEGSNIKFTDDVSSYNRFNPSNMLCLFDLQFKSSKINVLNIYDNNTYNIIPVME